MMPLSSLPSAQYFAYFPTAVAPAPAAAAVVDSAFDVAAALGVLALLAASANANHFVIVA